VAVQRETLAMVANMSSGIEQARRTASLRIRATSSGYFSPIRTLWAACVLSKTISTRTATTIVFAGNTLHRERSRHIGVRKYYVRELVQDKLVKLMDVGIALHKRV